MRESLSIAATVILCLSMLSTPCRAGDFSISNWSHMAAILMDKPVKKGVVEIEVTPPVFDLSRRDLHDLRVIADRSEEMGFVTKTARPYSYKSSIAVKLYNRSHIPGSSATITADFKYPVMKNRLEIVTKGDNFRRKARIEASDNGTDWKVIRDDGYLFRIPGESGDEPLYDKNTIGFPDNNQRYMKITVFNGQDDTNPIVIKEVRGWRLHTQDAKIESIPDIKSSVKQKKKMTEITLDLGFRNMPLHKLTLGLEGDNFYRRIDVLGRNEEFRTVKRVVEDSPALEKKVEAPWKSITDASVWRFSVEGGSQESSLSVDLGRAKQRYLLIRIHNGDDPPLKFTGATVTRLKTFVDFAPRKQGRYELYFGNPKASKAKYDFHRYVGKLRREGTIQAKLGGILPNPEFNAAAKRVPWSERHRALLWIALLGMVAALGVLVFRMALFARNQAEP